MQRRQIGKSRYGLGKVVYEIEGLITNSYFAEGKLYEGWLELSTWQRKKFLEQVRKVMKKELLGAKFMKALAEEILEERVGGEGEKYVYVRTEAPLYKYLLKYVYGGRARDMLEELESIRRGK